MRRSVFDAGATGSFQMNLANVNANGGYLRMNYSHNRLETVTEKEHKQSPQARTSLKGMDPDSLEVMAIKHISRKPTEKWDLPATTAQESGWLIANPVRAQSLMLPSPPPPRRSRSHARHRKGGVGGLWGPDSPPRVVPERALMMPANTKVLDRIKSAPELPMGHTAPELRHINSRRWYRPKGGCDVTDYAEAYITMNHLSPYSNKSR